MIVEAKLYIHFFIMLWCLPSKCLGNPQKYSISEKNTIEMKGILCDDKILFRGHKYDVSLWANLGITGTPSLKHHNASPKKLLILKIEMYYEKRGSRENLCVFLKSMNLENSI